jgi:hypothetical protein
MVPSNASTSRELRPFALSSWTSPRLSGDPFFAALDGRYVPFQSATGCASIGTILETAGWPAMIPDLDIWRAALLMVKRYGDDAMLEAAAGALAEIK